MSDSKKMLLFTVVIGLAAFLLWKISGIALSKPVIVDYSNRPYFPTESTAYEWGIYWIFAVLLSACFYFPFYLAKKINSLRAVIGILGSVVAFFILIGFVSSNIKGVLASNWFGEDYGFGTNITKVFFVAPVIYYFINKLSFPDFPFKNLFYFFIMNFAVYFLARSISYPVADIDEMPVRFILLDGYFVFLYALAFGLIGWHTNRMEFKTT